MKAAVSAMLVCLVAVVTVTLTITSAFAQARSLWTPPPLSEIKKASSAGIGSLEPFQGRQEALSRIGIVLPTTDKALRGVVDVKAEGVELGGYVVFRIDGEFAYATATPYSMRWDTAGMEDGEHEIQVAAFGADRQLAGYGSTQVRVRNRILGAVPAEGVSLLLRARKGQTVVKNVQAKAEVAGLNPQLPLPAGLQGIEGRLYARMSQSILSIDPTDNSANLRTSVRIGMLSTNGVEKELEEKGHYGIASLMSSGLEIPPPPGSQRPRIGLGEVSLAVPVGLVHEGTTWTSPMRVIPTLAQRNSIEVEGSHTFQGVWWMKGRRCARISSVYDIDEVYLSASKPAPAALAALPGYVTQLTQGGQPGGKPQGIGKVGGKQDPQSTGRKRSRAGRPGGGMGRARAAGIGAGRTRGTTRQRTRTTRPRTRTVTTDTLRRLTTPATRARLTGVSGDRTTWIDIDKGIVVRIEDHVTGTLVILDTASGSTNASLFSPSGAAGHAMKLTGSIGGRGRGGGTTRARSSGGGRSGGRSGSFGRGSSSSRRGGGRRPSSGSVQRRIIRSTPSEAELPELQRFPYSLTLMIEIVH